MTLKWWGPTEARTHSVWLFWLQSQRITSLRHNTFNNLFCFCDRWLLEMLSVWRTAICIRYAMVMLDQCCVVWDIQITATTQHYVGHNNDLTNTDGNPRNWWRIQGQSYMNKAGPPRGGKCRAMNSRTCSYYWRLEIFWATIRLGN